jgi:hypothetical protein
LFKEQARKHFFFEKRSKKLLIILSREFAGSVAQRNQSFFASFFSKKEELAFSLVLSCQNLARLA